MASQRADYDSPWKDILEAYFEECILFFFPDVHADVSWDRGYEFLDKELQSVVKEAEVGRRYADKLVKVWRLSGESIWVLIHIEVQSQSEPDFEERMFTYYYRLKDRFNRPVASFAILSDDSASWRPVRYLEEIWGCRNSFEFRMVKLLDYKRQWSQLEDSQNPFAVVVMAHLKTIETVFEPEKRKQWKLALSKGLYKRGYSNRDFLALLRFIGWVLSLPDTLERSYWQEIQAYQEESKVPYRLWIEEQAMEKGREEGIRGALLKSIRKQMSRQFGDSGLQTLTEIEAVDSTATLEAIQDSLFESPSIEEIRRLLKGQV